MFDHADIWRAIDILAERNGLTASGLARRAGLNATLLNPSKRSSGKRNRWPSTETLSAILKSTNCSLEAFSKLLQKNSRDQISIPFFSLSRAASPLVFDKPSTSDATAHETFALPFGMDGQTFALDIDVPNLSPIYPIGTILLVSRIEKPRRGDRVAVCLSKGEILLKILSREGAQKYELGSLSPDDPPLTISKNDVHGLYRVIWASQ